MFQIFQLPQLHHMLGLKLFQYFKVKYLKLSVLNL